MPTLALRRLGLVVHPRRAISNAVAIVQDWSDANGAELVQIAAHGQDRRVAELGDVAGCDLVVAIGGDGTALAAVRLAAPAGKPVLGVACGSLGALTVVDADRITEALDRVAAGDWSARRLPALVVESDGQETLTGVNDLVIVRQGASQVIVGVRVDGELFVRFAGDGLVIAAPLGASAYTLAAGGPMLAPGGSGLVFTPLAPHGGSCPPLVAGPGSRLDIELEPGWGGARIELDGQVHGLVDPQAPRALSATLRADHATLVALGGEEPLFAGLRRRGILMDSPRIRARDARAPVV
jgi:NAD+ kinase